MGKRIELSPWVCFQWALALLILPLNWIMAIGAAAGFHELGHIVMLKLLGVQVNEVTVGSGGMVIRTEPMPPWKELLSALAGPGASFSLLLLSRWFPLTALCAMVQGLFNLLPVPPLDGGRALDCMLALICPGGREKGMEIARGMTLLVIGILGIGAAAGLKMGIWGILAVLILLWKVLPRKRPCKEAGKRVQ